MGARNGPAAFRRGGLVAMFAGLALCAPLVSASAQDMLTEAADRILPNADDSWVITVHVSHQGHEIYKDEDVADGYSNITTERWRYGPATASVRLVTYDSADQYGESGISIMLAMWQARIAQYIDWQRNQPFYADMGDALTDPLDEAKALSEDAELLIRVLEAVERYVYLDRDSYAPESPKPTSGEPLIHLEGGVYESSFRGTNAEPKDVQVEMAPWSSRQPGEENVSAGKQYGVVVWRFTPEDMQRVDELIDEYDDIEARLTLDLSGHAVADNMSEALRMSPYHFHRTFRDPFLAALHEISRLAWWLGPHRAPDGAWATSDDQIDPVVRNEWEVIRDNGLGMMGDRAGTPVFRDGVDISLPPLETDTIIMLTMPWLGMEEFPETLPEKSGYYGPTSMRRRSGVTYNYTVGNPARERVRAEDPEEEFSAEIFVHAAVSGERFDGRVNLTREYFEVTDANDGATLTYDEREVRHIFWSLEHDGEIWKPGPVEIAASLVQPQGGGFVPLEGKLTFGEPFAVEGRLEKPAARQVYNLELEYGGERPFDVLLYPTEEDPSLLRSPIHYFMWDVTYADAEGEGG